jgi:hypothetical protein
MAGRSSRAPWPSIQLAVSGIVAVAAVTACGGSPRDPGPATPVADTTFTTQHAATVLAQFDRADSAASSAGDIQALQATETAPVLDTSIAAIHRSQAQHQQQRPFQHLQPVFAIAPSCFLATANLKSTGNELTRTDVSEFVHGTDGTWKLSLNVQVGQDAVTTVRAIGGQSARGSDQAIPAARRTALQNEVFSRTTGSAAANDSVLAPSVLLDQQFAAGWHVYQQQLAGAGMTVHRALVSADWSRCAATVPGGTMAFLTLNMTDTITALPGGPADVTLGAQSPDLISVGRHTAISGRTVVTSRIENFLLLVPDGTGIGASLLGLDDAPLAVSAT